jgi:hypothetical protein
VIQAAGIILEKNQPWDAKVSSVEEFVQQVRATNPRVRVAFDLGSTGRRPVGFGGSPKRIPLDRSENERCAVFVRTSFLRADAGEPPASTGQRPVLPRFVARAKRFFIG